MIRRRPPLRLVAVLFACLLPSVAAAWSSDGHRIVGELAAADLNPKARAEVARLLAGEPEPTLAGVAAWADRLRDEDPERGKATSRWHYVNFADATCTYDAARDCAKGDCVVGAINRHFLALSDARRSDAERAEALKFLVHFVGDVHQPLHAGHRPDKGGNDFQVNVRGKGSNLHAVWDRTILEAAKREPAAYAAALRARAPLPRDPTLRSQTPAVDWAVESCRLTDTPGLYPPRRVLDDAYFDAQRPLAERRLREAGARLAAMLNRALGR
ncbi:S1/P1 nuclease [Tolypothrix campylonemoides VB511288]|nr:S1/P1 nuclease [Tolypothrix campylonemoides VB511288]